MKWISKQQVIEEVIIPAIEANGDYVADRSEFNLDWVFEECFRYSELDGGFVQIATEQDFWKCVEAAAYDDDEY